MKKRCIWTAASVGLVAVVFAPGGAMPQAPAASAASADANQLLLQAIRSNGLTGEGQKPWHIRISFDVAAAFLQDADTGTIEEWWISDTHYKRTITGKTFTQTQYGTESGLKRAGVRSAAPPIYSNVLNAVIRPINIPEDAVPSLSVNQAERKVGDARFSCLATEMGKTTPTTVKAPPWIYCLDADHPILRMGAAPNGSGRDFRNHIVLFEGRYIAKQVEYTLDVPGGHNPQRIWSVQVEQLEGLKDEDAKQIDPPPGTPVAPAKVTLSGKEAKALLLNHPMPEYPAIAKVLQASGDVVCKVWVDVDGHVINAGLVSGPLTLQGTALDALRKWTFKPVQANGDAAEMETTITIRFQIVSPGSLSTVVRLVE
jgi:TonB family protein